MPKYEHDSERWLRNNADIYTRMGSPQIAQNMVLCADEIKKLRMAVDLGEQGAEHMVEELAKVKGELAALKEAARPVAEWYTEIRNHAVWDGKKVNPEMTVLGGCTVAQYDALAALVVEG